MKLLITTLTLIFLSFEVFAKETIYNCTLANWKMKVETSLFSKKKIYIRDEGLWNQLCTRKNDIISKDSFKCFYGEKNKELDYYVLDEKFKILTVHKKNGSSSEYNCYIKK